MIQKESKFKVGEEAVALVINAEPQAVLPGTFKILGVRLEGTLVYNHQSPTPLEISTVTYWISNGEDEVLGVYEAELLTPAEAMKYPTHESKEIKS
jgi:hypothetical protein